MLAILRRVLVVVCLVISLRPYQLRAVDSVRSAWQEHRSVCLVAPTGSGKTVMGAAIVGDSRALWICHRVELVAQARARLPITCEVATVQGLIARSEWPAADLIVLDECHHYAADTWRAADRRYPHARIVGLTATPERSDGRPLGDLFSHLVVAANYSELIEAGHLVRCRVFRPTEQVIGGLAQSVPQALERYGVGRQAFVFCSSIDDADRTAAAIGGASICADTPATDRRARLERFAAGELRHLTSVFALTEGVDVPQASCCVLARGAGFRGAYLQMVGRVLRPSPGKTDAVLIDLSGASHAHGLPCDDRTYSLDGTAISAERVGSLKNCPQCGATVTSPTPTCPECGWVWITATPKAPRIYSLELAEVFAGAETPIEAKRREWSRLMKLALDKHWGVSWAAREYRKLFGSPPTLSDDEARRAYAELASVGRSRGFKPGFAFARFRSEYGRVPPK